MNYTNRLMEKERKFLMSQKNNLNRIIFIGTHQEDVHEQYIQQLLEDIENNNIYDKSECEIIKNNIFCLDLINDDEEYNINEIKNILKRTFELCTRYYNLIRDEANKCLKNTLLNENEKINGFEAVKSNRYNQGKQVINSRSWKIFGLGFIPIPFLDKSLMKDQMNEMIKDLVSIYKDCKNEIYNDNLYGVIVSKALGEVISVGGGIAGAVATGTLGSASTGAAGAAGTAAATGVSTAAKVAGGFGIGFILLGVTGLISGSLGRNDCLEFGEKMLNRFQEIFEKNFKREDFIKSSYDSFIESIEKSKKIIGLFQLGQTYDSSLYY